MVVPKEPDNFEFVFRGKPAAADFCTIPIHGYEGYCHPTERVGRNGDMRFTSYGHELHKNSDEITEVFGKLSVPKGDYTIYALVSDPDHWQLIINKQTGQWGTEYNQGQDLGRTPMRAATLPSPQENMTISFEHSTKSSTELHVRWETTDEWVKIEAH